MKQATRLPILVNGLVSLGMLLLIGLFGLEVGLAPPPTLAALEPQTQKPPQAPPEQSILRLPGGAFGGKSPAALPSPSPSPQAAQVATRQCYQLTQTPDPQSPPCREGFDPLKQSNGGSTAQGVTGDSIYVVYPCLGGFYERCQDIPGLVKFFNEHFEFYGRKLVLIDPWCPAFNVSGCGGPAGGSVSQMQTDAGKAAHANDAAGGIFASLSYYPQNGDEHYYYDTLAGQYHVASVSSVPNSEPESHYQQYNPFEWAVTPTLDYTEENLGQFMCRTMAGHPPSYAQSTPQWTPPANRKFGVVWTQNPDGSNPDLAPLTDILQGCASASSMTIYKFDGSSTGSTTLSTQLMQDNISTIACVCGNPASRTALANAAHQQGYRPEWVVWPFGFQDVDSYYYQYTDANCACTVTQWPSDEQNGLIGFSDFNKVLPPDEEFWYEAMREGNPSYQYGDNGDDIYDYYRYEELMDLATGIQMAGPHLTPQTFAAALEAYPAADPGHGQAPYYQALVSFSSSHGWIQDYAPVYWNSNAQNFFTNEPRNGSLCYVTESGVGPGVRYGLNQWPNHPLAFYPPGTSPPCR